MKKSIAYVAILAILMAVIPSGAGAAKQGEHTGERKMLDVEIAFLNPYGAVVANQYGLYYMIWGYVFYEDKVYPEKYWGTYPLYFSGVTVPVTVKITNNGPREIAKVRIKTEAHVLLVDGSSGVSLIDPKITEIEVLKGETKIVDVSFFVEYRCGVESGLRRFLVEVSHVNEGSGPGNAEPGLIMVKEGIFV